MREWRRLAIQVKEVEADLDRWRALVARSCHDAQNAMAATRRQIAESRELLLQLSDPDERRP